MISASDANSMTEGGNVARQWLFQAMADPQVTTGTGLFIGNVSWVREGRTLGLTGYGVDPTLPGFLSPDLAATSHLLQLQDVAILDRLIRGLSRDVAAAIRPQTPLTFEVSGRTLTLLDTFAGGGGFGGDGYMLMSDQTFLNIFPKRHSSAPDHVLLKLAKGANPDTVVARLRDAISDKIAAHPHLCKGRCG